MLRESTKKNFPLLADVGCWKGIQRTKREQNIMQTDTVLDVSPK